MQNNTPELCGKGIYNFSPYIFYRNEQLMKDCCLIPYLFHQYFGYRAVIVTAQREDYTYLELLKGLEMDILDTPKDLEEWIKVCCNYIADHYKKIDIMFCFGGYSSHSKMVQQYKKLRPDGKVVLKLDANLFWEDKINFRDIDYQPLLDRCDVITVESKKLQRYLSKKWPYKIDYMPNGSADLTLRKRTEYSEKENTILTVGRIGSEQKANDVLMEAFGMVGDELPQWKLKLIGNVDSTFQSYVDEFFIKYPRLKERIIFTGKILDKDCLEKEYKKAKIFALTSIMEGGTPNVWAEAARNGCYIVCSEIDAVEEATNWGQCGKSFEINNRSQLADIFLELCKDESSLSKGCSDIQEYRECFFDYEKIVYKLEHLINLPLGEV